MKKIILLLMLFAHAWCGQSQNINGAEYFIDIDPGKGNAVPITVTAGSNVPFVASIPTTSLASGFHNVGIRTKDVNDVWGLFETRSFYISSSTANAANIAAAEYFLDADPGKGNGIPIGLTAGGIVPFVATIPTSSLTAGFHNIAIRTKDANENWGLFENRSFYISSSTTNAANISAAEYFIDADPGKGNGIPITVTAGSVVPFVATIPTTSLAAGFHNIAIRTKDANENWGLFENRSFYISSSTSNAANISAAEYFIDADPGKGNGVPITVTAGSIVPFVATIPTTSLAAGFHNIAIRTKDANENWGLFENRSFYISSSTTNAANIAAAEYFIDADPGKGNGVPITVTAGSIVPFVATIATTSLGDGFHTVAIRTKDANEHWGLFETRSFYISTQTTNAGIIVSGEYFFDADPGVGNATAFTFTTPGNTVIQTFNLATSPTITPGVHKLALRTKDANGKWGLFEVASDITIAGPVPLNLLSFTGRKEKEIVKLNWRTENEINTHHFEVQRSANGIDFTNIGTVSAFNTSGQHNYIFDDANPLKQLSFYRLKQIDINGSFTYSNIVKINVDDTKYQLRIYPNPTANKLMIDWNGSGKNILIKIMDSKAAVIETKNVSAASLVTVNVSSLTQGLYYIELNDGEIVKRSSFIKQ